jgi:hypothetical protein
MAPKVFVSYSHDSDAHRARVADFVARLRGEGIDVVYYEDLAKVGGPDEGWPRWCQRQIVECDYVLACCTALFRERFDDAQVAQGEYGVAWEAYFIRQYLYDNLIENRKVRSLIFEEADRAHIPNALRPFPFFVATDDRSCANLLGWLKAVAVASAAQSGAAVDWPPPTEDFPRRLADREDEFERFKSMLAGHSPQRILLVQGPSGVGKTALMHECIDYAEHRRVRYSQVHFKGVLALEDVFKTLIADLGKGVFPKTCVREPAAWAHEVLVDLQQLRQPLFLVFDSYEIADQASQSWIEMLLSHMDPLPCTDHRRGWTENSGTKWAELGAACLYSGTSSDLECRGLARSYQAQL